ncbi:MAG: N-acetyltransferase [Gammaproteobacteria bacterium]|nr:N-acetyltransferase [Gammaproteobacteria bacterium]HJO11502.1 N-acetyltransferase [Gammaproteobacteria bacterium]
MEFSYQNCLIVEDYQHVKLGDTPIVGMLQAFPMRVDPDYVEEDEILRPYSELEQDNSYYVSGVAIYPEFRNNKIGQRLMQRAEFFARIEKLDSVSLIVFEQNTGAKKLYERLGYQVIGSRGIVPHPLIHHTGEALLMAKEIKSGGWLLDPLELNYSGFLVDGGDSHEAV